MKNSRLIFLLTALLPGLALANSAPEQGPPVKQQPSTANPVPPPPDCIPCEEEPVDPVVLSGGKLYYPAVDVEVPGLGRAFNMNLRFFRGYSSQDNTVGVLGLGWSTTLDIYLGNTGGAVPWFHIERGEKMGSSIDSPRLVSFDILRIRLDTGSPTTVMVRVRSLPLLIPRADRFPSPMRSMANSKV